MNRTYVPTRSLEDWQFGLSDSDKHWKDGFSARMTAQSWHQADGFPTSIQTVFAASGEPYSSLEPLLILPEHKVSFPPHHARPSQNDVWVLASHRNGLASIAVEGKKDESFGPALGEWKSDGIGKTERFQFLTDLLQLPQNLDDKIRYQFLHRTASALIEAQRFRANMALCLIQSFSENSSGWSDFYDFVQLYGKAPQPNEVVSLGVFDNIPLSLAWINN